MTIGRRPPSIKDTGSRPVGLLRGVGELVQLIVGGTFKEAAATVLLNSSSTGAQFVGAASAS